MCRSIFPIVELFQKASVVKVQLEKHTSAKTFVMHRNYLLLACSLVLLLIEIGAYLQCFSKAISAHLILKMPGRYMPLGFPRSSASFDEKEDQALMRSSSSNEYSILRQKLLVPTLAVSSLLNAVFLILSLGVFFHYGDSAVNAELRHASTWSKHWLKTCSFKCQLLTEIRPII